MAIAFHKTSCAECNGENFFMASLTPKKRVVLAWIWNPRKPSYSEIARYMDISNRTVEKYVERRYKKTGFRSRKQLEKIRGNELMLESSPRNVSNKRSYRAVVLLEK